MNSFRRKKDSFYMILERKYSFCRYSNPRSMDYKADSLPQSSDLLMNGHKSSVYQVSKYSLFTNQSSTRNCHKMTNCEQFRAKCYVKIVATLTLATTDVFLIKIWQECYNSRESWVFFFFPLKFCEVMLLLKIDKAFVSKNSHIILCMSWCYTCEKSI